MKRGKTGVFVASKIPLLMKQYVLQAITKGRYISTSDFIRSAIKEKIERENVDWNMKLRGADKDD
jgi:Arc/MetJ-type ribon-helix-helix transcriptional regulator